ncbi:hypothetical protein [Streptodolium elevatio]|uniref:Uncharacterized protein n=1 Tax=Streptodolium elevatio TaxID=3157996 RepID=A0ABV3DEQ2_9ACTN
MRPDRPRGSAVFVAGGASATLHRTLFAYCEGAVWSAGAFVATKTRFKECSIPGADPPECDVYIADGAPTPRLTSCIFGQYAIGISFPVTSGLILTDVEFGTGWYAFQARGGANPALVEAINAEGTAEGGTDVRRPAYTKTFPPVT